MFEKILVHTGRSLLALYFLIPGALKFIAWETHVEMMEKRDMLFIPVLLAAAGIIQIIASLCLLINRYLFWSALTLAGLTLLINYNLHDFWNMGGDPGAGHETQNFFKNLGIFAGLLVLAGFNPKNK